MTKYLGYSSLQDYFPTMVIRPNPGCINPLCRAAQEAYASSAPADQPAAVEEEVKLVLLSVWMCIPSVAHLVSLREVRMLPVVIMVEGVCHGLACGHPQPHSLRHVPRAPAALLRSG